MLKEMIKIENCPTAQWVGPAVEFLLRGGVVGFPTETVYGLAAAPGVPGAIDKLNRLKKRPADKPYTLHIGSPKKLEEYVPNPSWPAKILARKGWPGPLTMIVELNEAQVRFCREKFGDLYDHLYHDNSIGLRCPDHPVANALLNHCELPVVAPSANPADLPPALDAQQVEHYFGDQVDLILDAGPVRYRKASTVVKTGPCGYEILREGVIDRRSVDRLMSFMILFVCSGNTCRSPMAEGLCRKILPRLLGCQEGDLTRLKINIASAGTFATRNMPPSRSAVAVLNKMGIDLSNHHSQPVTAPLVTQADLILVMSPEHKDFICDLVPGVAHRVKLLNETGVADPIGGSDEVYFKCAQNLENLIEARLKELL
jgi:tRNA threonylcarbamoyl adenosine modification protein (Sua5/YciO/YrdC/YwlC family)